MLLLISLPLKSLGQYYGLSFLSHEVVQDQRTALDLTPGHPLCLQDEFDLSFDFSFAPNQRYYFGYLLRVINGKHNIDFLFDAQSKKNQFNLVIGERQSHITFDIDSAHLFGKWNNIKISFNCRKDEIVLYWANKRFVENGIGLKHSDCFKLLFGAGQYGRFQTTDVPPMRLKDIRIFQNKTLSYHWPLDEQSGTVAVEKISKLNGLVNHPVWLKALHQKWTFEKRITVSGVASVAFDPKKEAIYIIAADSLYTYSTNSNHWERQHYQEGILKLSEGNQSYYNPLSKSIYNILPAQPTIPVYDLTTKSWNTKIDAAPLTSHWQFNKMYCRTDSSMYVFGGYGHLYYKNDVRKYSFQKHKWSKLNPSGHFFTPRYLAALGATRNGDTAYVLGGYGNTSGKQILNPQNLYDLVRFTTKDQAFKKLYAFENSQNDFVFANSLVIDKSAKNYYALIYPANTYNSHLQLIHGSLSVPKYKLLADPIPYQFHDTHSFADLYYCPSGKRFVAVTLLRADDNKSTVVQIYTLLCPPLAVTTETLRKERNNPYLLYSGILLLAGLGGFLLYRFRKKEISVADDTPEEPTLTAMAEKEGGATEMNEFFPPYVPASTKVLIRNSIFLFGEFQVYDAGGNDITKSFTPLVKELFLIILLYSVKRGRGISSETLDEILWYGKSEKSARNNRYVNMTKLKTILEKLGCCSLSKDTGYWKIDIDYHQVFVDYYYYSEVIKDQKKLNIQTIKEVASILRRGNFLSGIEYEWLDQFKSEISNDIIDHFLRFVHSGHLEKEPELLVEIANLIFYFDPVNEDAMILKCRALSSLGKHSLARNTFENFAREYKAIYGEKFSKDFQSIAE